MSGSIKGLTGFIVRHAGVSYWLAAAIKYALFSAVISGSIWIGWSKFTGKYKQIGYDKCKAEQTEAVQGHKEVADDVTEERDDQINDDKQEQRDGDSVTRRQYNDLKREKYDERLTFERLLRDAINQKNDDGSNSCAGTDMPVGLQRRVKSETDNN